MNLARSSLAIAAATPWTETSPTVRPITDHTVTHRGEDCGYEGWRGVWQLGPGNMLRHTAGDWRFRFTADIKSQHNLCAGRVASSSPGPGSPPRLCPGSRSRACPRPPHCSSAPPPAPALTTSAASSTLPPQTAAQCSVCVSVLSSIIYFYFYLNQFLSSQLVLYHVSCRLTLCKLGIEDQIISNIYHI